jgi:hypothetical protein
MLPNFLVIGAAKAGTTALHWYLKEHPSVFMTPVKDPSYFAYGLDADGKLLWGDPELHPMPVKSLSEYERLFADGGDATAIGEASTMYLECPQSAARIRELLPAARIICSLRHPVERAYSDYVMGLRRRGRRFDPTRDLTVASAWARPNSRCMQIGRYYEQLSRYFERFPRHQIHVFLFDDLKRNAPGVMRDVFRFLDVDPGFEPDFATPHAPGGMPRSVLLESFFTSRAIRSAVEPWMPARAANWVRRLRTRNMRQVPRLPADLKQELTGHFRDDIARTAELIARSLDHWL